jgi:AcrR family transcriptional regulator
MARIRQRIEAVRAARVEKREVRAEQRQQRSELRAEHKQQRRELDDAPRRRRAPEEARVEILDAAERVFVELHPDQVGLKEVASEAGISHSLITHYFGSYAAMVEAVLERRIRVLRERMLDRLRDADGLARPTELLTALFRGLEDPVHLRLTKWLLASDRPNAAHAFALRDHGLQLVAHQIAVSLDPPPTVEQIGKIELALLAAVSSAYGYAIGKYALAGALGRPVGSELDNALLETIGKMVETHLRTELGLTLRRA